MSQLAARGQQIPKLAKTKQLQNPYQSNTLAATSLSRIFLLNDRSKVRLTEQSESEDDEPTQTHAIGDYTNRVLTFGAHKKSQSMQWGDCETQAINELNQVQTTDRSSFKKQSESIQLKKDLIPEQKNIEIKLSTQKLLQQIPNFRETIRGREQWEQDGQNNNYIERIRRQSGQNSKISLQSSSNSNKNHSSSASIKSSKISDLGVITLKYKQEVDEELDQQVAQEDDMDELWNKDKNKHLQISRVARSKPSLHEGSLVGEVGGVGRGSIIDRIKNDTFSESIVLENHKPDSNSQNNESAHNNNTNSIMKKQKINSPQGQPSSIQNNTQSVNKPKLRQRIKIFDHSRSFKTTTGDNNQTQTPRKKESKPAYQASPHSRSTHRYEPEITRAYTHNFTMEENRGAQPYSICPHTQCILKSLQIIDKLTGPSSNHSQPPQHYSRVENRELDTQEILKQQIESQSLDISMRVDQLLVEIVLADLLEEQTGIKIRKLKYEVEQLINKIKAKDEESQRIKNDNISMVTKASRLQNRWQLCDQMQKICKSLHFIQIVQERYKMWKVRLHHLSQRIKDILKVDRSQQIKKLGDIASHIQELQSSKFYGAQALGMGVVEAYNTYIDREAEQLQFTMEWIKNDIISD